MDFKQITCWIGYHFSWSDLLPVLLLVSAIWGIQKAPKGHFYEEPLNKHQGLALRGLFSCIIMLCHLAVNNKNDGFLFARFEYLGPLSVCVFFGLSGYGIMLQRQTRDGYLDGFLGKRFATLFWPYSLFSALTCIQWQRGDFLLLPHVHEWFGLVTYGWYCCTIFLYYIAFYYGCRIADKEGGPPMAYIIAIVLLETLAMNQINPYRPRFYKGMGAFLVGVAMGENKDKWRNILIKHRRFLTCLMVIIVLAHLSCAVFYFGIDPGRKMISRCILHCFFFAGVATLGLTWQLGNRVLTWLGTISYELYLTHGWVMQELRHWWPNLLGDGYVYAVVVLSLAMATAVHWGIGCLRRSFKGDCLGEPPRFAQ